MSIIVGIDVGGSTTKIVGFSTNEKKVQLIEPQFVRANDPVTATYGAFGKFTDENRINIQDIDRVMMTGVGSSYVKRDLYGIECLREEEFNCIGLGGLQQLAHIFINDLQPGGKIHAGRGGDGAAAQKGTVSPVRFDQAEACDSVARVDS